MPLHYILDGYNILNQVSYLTDQKLKHGRSGLIQLLENARPLKKQRIILVFDGYQGDRQRSPRVDFEILFSNKSSADQKIKNLVEHSAKPGNIRVVTDDKEIRFFVRSLGARVLSVAEFLSQITARSESSRSSPDKKNVKERLKYQDILEINRELRKLWLKDTE